MSTYYDFFLARKQGDCIEAIGPYVKRDGEFKLEPIISRSRSFINWDDFDAWQLSVKAMAKEQVNLLAAKGIVGDEFQSCSYYMPYEDIAYMANDGLIKGYVTLDELDMVTKNDYDPNCLRDIWVRSAETVAEMDSETRKEYGHIAYVDNNSSGYLCRLLISLTEELRSGIKSEELYFIIRVC